MLHKMAPLKNTTWVLLGYKKRVTAAVLMESFCLEVKFKVAAHRSLSLVLRDGF